MSNSAPFPIDYTSRDYSSIRNDLIQLIRNRTGINWQADDPSDIGVAILEAFCYMGDVANYYIDRAANETFIDTATQRQTLLNLAKLYGYRPSGPTPASVDVTFINKGTTPLDIPVGTQVVAPLQYGAYSEVFFETTKSATALAPNATITLPAVEGKTVNTDRPDLIDPATNTPLPTALGTSTGLPSQVFVLPDAGVVDGTVRAYVGQGAAFTEWVWVDSLIEWGPTDTVFTTEVNSDGSSSVVFGDGVNGSIPRTSQLVSSTYKVSEGAAGNVIAGQISEVSFIPGNINVSALTALKVNNQVSASGGANADDNTQIRAKIKRAIQARRRAVTLWDYEALCLLVPQVGRARAIANTASSVTLYVQPQDDGSISPGVDPDTGEATAAMVDIQNSVVDYFADKAPVNTTVTVVPPTYVDIDLALTVVVGRAYKRTAVKQAITSILLDVRAGLFSYYSYTFGETVALSQVIAALSGVAGITSVTVTKLAKHGQTGAGDILLDASELPRLLSTNLTINATGGLA
jgi:uncharacterized phage protein gp47/JayE